MARLANWRTAPEGPGQVGGEPVRAASSKRSRRGAPAQKLVFQMAIIHARFARMSSALSARGRASPGKAARADGVPLGRCHAIQNKRPPASTIRLQAPETTMLCSMRRPKYPRLGLVQHS